MIKAACLFCVFMIGVAVSVSGAGCGSKTGQEDADMVSTGGMGVTKRSCADTESRGERTEGVTVMEKATFAAGCFWGIEAAFRKTDGVVSTQVGYTGGTKENPTYREVCTDETGHAEAVEVTYDPSRVSYKQLLKLFWQLHDPTQVNRQGPDMGSQYRSAIFFHDDEQRALAQASKHDLEKSGKYERPITTQIVPAVEFYRAEEYHQQYLEKRGRGACSTH